MKLILYHYPNIPIASTLLAKLAAAGQLPKGLADLGVQELLALPNSDSLQLLLIAEKAPTFAQVSDWLTAEQFVESSREAPPAKTKQDRDVLRLLLEIASGTMIDSAGNNLFENLQEHYTQAREAGWAGPVLQYIFQRCVWLHEKSRMETDLFKFAIHEHSVLRELAQKIFGSLQRCTTSVAGRQSDAEAFLTELRNHGCKKFMLFHDQPEEAGLPDSSGLYQHLGSDKFSFQHCDLLLVFDPAYAQHFERRKLKQQLSKRQSRPLLIFDWTNSVHVAQASANLYFYSRTDLAAIIEHNLHARTVAVAAIQHWIETEIDKFYQWLSSDNRNQFAGIIGATKAMQHIFELISRIARTNITVLIDGESGTGKELVARAIHRLSGRSEHEFIPVNCGAIPDTLLESELFGHVRGAFTGAVAEKPGLFEQAQHGTIFLDEIAELAPNLQVKLLRFLQEGEIRRVGSNYTIHLDVRVLAATNTNLSELVSQNRFRSDLYYRLNVMQLTLPALRERRQDIPLLANHFLKRFAKKFQKSVTEIADEALNALLAYHWPGNIRELENAIEHATALAVGKSLSHYDLPNYVTQKQHSNGRLPSFGRISLRELEKQYIIDTLEEFDWDYEFVCKQLGIGRTTLWRKLKEYKINK